MSPRLSSGSSGCSTSDIESAAAAVPDVAAAATAPGPPHLDASMAGPTPANAGSGRLAGSSSTRRSLLNAAGAGPSASAACTFACAC
eukprot:9541728-Alexandrium_andersonii.AAC.2